MDDALTLVVPTRAAGPLLEAALASALPQLRPGDEVCVFDNQDEPGVDARLLSGAPCPASVVTRERVLPGERSWTRTLSLGGRPWVLWLHDDDLLRPGAVEALRSAAADGDVLAWGAAAAFAGAPPDWRDLPPPRLAARLAPADAIASYLFSHVHACSGTLLRRSALRASLPIPDGTGLASDRWLFQRVAAHGTSAVLQGVTVGYRRHAASDTSTHATRRRWRASLGVQRHEAARMLLERGVDAGAVAAVAVAHGREVVLDTLRSLIRARSPLAAPLAQAWALRAPALARGAAWRRVRAGTRWGPLGLEVLGPLEWVARAAGRPRG